MKYRILYIVSSLRKSGPIVVLHNIISHLDQDIYNVEIVKLSSDEKDRSVTKEFVDLGIRVHELNFTKLQIELFPQKVANKIDEIISERKIKLIHTHGYQAVIVGSKIRNNIPRIETVHCISEDDFCASKGKMIGKYMTCRYLQNLKKFNEVIAISKSVQQYVRSKLSTLPITIVPNGVTDVNPSLENKENLRKRLGLSIRGVIFMVVGSLIIRKDPITIIKAFKIAFPKKDFPEYELNFIGKGNLKEECESIIGDDDRIKLLGWHENSYDYLKAADWSVSASHSEGFGLNFVESLMVGTPIISTRIPAFNEFMMIFPELDKYRFNPGSIDELVKKFKLTIGKEQINKLSLIKGAKKYFSSSTMAQQYMDVYKELIPNE